MSNFNDPWRFSFKDLLAIIFSGTFLYFCYRAMFVASALALVQILIPPISIILGGYFVQEAGAMWLARGQGMNNSNYNSNSTTQDLSGGDSHGV